MLPPPSVSRVAGSTPAARIMKASKREALDKILTLLRRDQAEGRSVHELASRTGYSVSSVRNLIGHLRREGYVIRTEATHYFLLEEPNHEQDRA